VLVDATIVRAFLLPAILGLLGEAAWWSPRWLGRRQQAELS
jgi:RND superfamily putative drug exporter